MSVPGVASRAADRFYCPPARRHLLDKQQKQHPPLTAAAVEEPAKPTPELRRDPPPSPALETATAANNLESFIASTAVRVPARRHPRAGTRGRGAGADGHGGAPYYELADLWDAFGEWSAYGAGVPLLLNGTDGVVQYYVPFLSAIQLYGSRPSSKRRFNEDSDDGSSPDTSSDHHEQQLTTSLLKAADDWLCQRQVDHPDYRFFLSH
uniref:Uncharacterized protein n=1 Tax=Setaria italica TaxID=4555 RepID=K3XM18_SETIT